MKTQAKLIQDKIALRQKLLAKTNIVGVIASKADMLYALRHPQHADIYEWRADIWIDDMEGWLKRLSRPVILTVREQPESRKARYTSQERATIYSRYTAQATFIDIAAHEVTDFGHICAEAKEMGVGLIVDDHTYEGAWNFRGAQASARIAESEEADILKLALLPQNDADFYKFAHFASELSRASKVKVAPMAMGARLGKISRLLFATTGSPLVYGYLSRCLVEGQWQVKKLRDMLERLNK